MERYVISNRIWTMRNDLKDDYLWTSQWWCNDGDGVELYIEKDNGGFELYCFSGIPSSHIYIDSVDFGVLWDKALKSCVKENYIFNKDISSTNEKLIKNYTHTQQCLILADYLCSLFCEYSDVSDYKQS